MLACANFHTVSVHKRINRKGTYVWLHRSRMICIIYSIGFTNCSHHEDPTTLPDRYSLKSMMLRQTMSLALIIIQTIFLLLLPSPISGFAAWLKCNRQLEEDEIIMNNKVRPVNNEVNDVTAVKLAIFDESGSTRVDVASNDGYGGAIVWMDDTIPLSFKIGLDQSTLLDLSDIQFVVETTSFHASPSPRPAPSPKVPTMTTPPKRSYAKKTAFTWVSMGGGLLCDGRRAHARGKNANVTYTLVPKKVGEDGIVAEIWAGWSEYHGAVTLTPRIVFKKKSDSIQDTATSDATDHQEEL